MKCEKCSNEAVFHYQSNINGEKSEYHLCAECAKSEGFGEMLDFRPRSMFDNFWGPSFGSFTGGFFNEPFSTLNDGFFGRRLFAPSLTLPSVKIVVGDPEKSTECGCGCRDNIPKDAGEEIRSKRELHALKHQLKSAIKAEEFEKAAELRDKIRELEK